MEKQHISNNKLDDYFALARDMKPIEGIQELENQIMNAQMGANKSLFHNLKFKIVMSTSIIVIAAYITSLFYLKNDHSALPFQKSQNPVEKQATKIENGFSVIKADKPASKKMGKILTDLANNQPDGGNLQADDFLSYLPGLRPVNAGNDFATRSVSTETSGPNGPVKFEGYILSGNIRPLELDRNHLEKMGFNAKTKYLEYTANIAHVGNLRYKNNDTAVDLAFNTISFINLSNKSFDFYPAFITDTLGRDPDGGEGMSALNIDSLLRDDKHKPYTNYNKTLNLVPVLVKQSDYNGFQGHSDLIFWFTVTDKLKDILSDINKPVPTVDINRYESDFFKMHPTAVAVPPYIPGNKINFLGHDLDSTKTIQAAINGQQVTLHRNTTSNKIKPTDLLGIKMLELNKDQLKKIGFTFNGLKMKYACNIKKSDGQMDISDSNIEKRNERLVLNGNGSFEFTSQPGGYGLRIDGKTKFKNGEDQDFYPVFISDRNGIQAIKYRFGNFESDKKWTDEYFLSQIRKLVPVLVKQDLQGKKDLVFWFNVTPSFLALLPDTISKDMGKEYNKLVNSESKTHDTTTVTTCKYFDVCQVPLEQEYGVKIYPNPAKDKINLEFWPPKNDGTIYTTVELTDLNGKLIQKNESPWYGRTASMNLEGVKPGIYLVIYKLSTGEVITNKVMITR